MRRLLRFPAASDILTGSGSRGAGNRGGELRAARSRNAAAAAGGEGRPKCRGGCSSGSGPSPATPTRASTAGGAGVEGRAAQPDTLYLEAGLGGGRWWDARRLQARRRRWQRRVEASGAGGIHCGRICRGKILRLAIPRLLSAAPSAHPPTTGAQGRVFGNRGRPLAAGRLPALVALLTDSLLP